MLNIFTTHLFRFFTLLVVMNHIFTEGSPVLIKTDGKKGNKGKLILIAGGKCGSPTLIKGGGKKGGEMILIGNQNGNCDKPKYHVVKQFVPVPYYVPKPIFKYILRHHYVPVRHVVVKPVPVPVPVKSYSSGYKSSGHGGSYGHGGGSSSSYGHGSNTYDSDSSAYSGDSSSGGSGGSGLSSSDDSTYSGSNIYGKYSLYGKSGMGPSPSTNSDYMTGSSQYHKSNSLYHYDPNSASSSYGSLLPSGSTATKVTMLSAPLAKVSLVPFSSSSSSAGEHSGMGSNGNSNNNQKDSSSSESYFYNSATANSKQAASLLNDDYGTRLNSASSSASPLSIGGSASNSAYHIAPVYQGPNGQLYSNGQILSKEFLKSNTVVQAFPASASASSSKSSTGGLLGMPSPFASSKSSGGSSSGGSPVSSNMGKDILQQYSAEIEEAKKWFSGLTSKRREDSAENTSSSNGASSSSSASEEDASLEKGKSEKEKLGKK